MLIFIYYNTVDKTTAKESKSMYTLQNETALGTLPVYVLRSERFQLLKTMCITGVFLFVLLIFIYFGCAMDWPTMEDLLTTPIGLVSLLIGMLGKFLFLPYMSLWLGSVIFPNAPAMRLSMFFTGVSPVCGTAIIWTFLVRGNLDLSIVMTCVSMLGSFVFMPAWLRYIDWIEYKNANVVVPYQTIPPYAGWFLPLPFLGLIVPLAIGYAIQTWMPRFADSMVNFLESFCIAVALFFMLLFFNIICAIIPNWDISWFVTGKVIIAGICIAWMGYLFGYLVMRMFGLPHPDAIAVAIVTGMLNTSIPIVLLCYVLPNPECDLLSVIPLAVAVMLVIPLITICICMVLVPCCRRANRPRRLPPAILHKLPLEPIPRSVIINA